MVRLWDNNPMLSHEQIWQAIDRLASTFGYSPSGLAKQAGLDPTSFNKSKLWPNAISIYWTLQLTAAIKLLKILISIPDQRPFSSFEAYGGKYRIPTFISQQTL